MCRSTAGGPHIDGNPPVAESNPVGTGCPLSAGWGEVDRVVEDFLGQVGEADALGAGVAAEDGERLVDADVPAFRKRTLGLFDEDAAVEGGLELRGEEFV